MLKSRFMRVFILSLTLLAAASALAQKVKVEFDAAANFRKYKTFAITEAHLNSRNPALNNDLIRKRMDADIERGLADRHLRMVPGGSDLTVQYWLGSAPRTEIEMYPAGWRGLGTRAVRVPYTEGTLVIDLRDSSTRSLVWRGIASAETRDPAKIEGKLHDLVKKSLKKYPPK